MAMARRNQVRGDITEGKTLRTLKEWNHRNKTFVLGITFPFGKYDGIFGMCFNVFRVGVKQDYFGEVAIQVRQILREIED